MINFIENMKDNTQFNEKCDVTNTYNESLRNDYNEEIQNQKDKSKRKSIGCHFMCPYCGAKCEYDAED